MGQAAAVDRVQSFEDAGGGPTAELKLRDGTVLLVPRNHPRFAHWATRLKEEQQTGDPVYVGYDAASRVVAEVLSPFARRIQAVGAEPEGDRLMVHLFMSPSTNFILTTRPGYAELRARLTAAGVSKEKLLVTSAVVDLEILDARLPPKE